MGRPGLEAVGGWAHVLGRLTRHEELDGDEATAAMDEILEGNASAAQIAGFVIGLRMKGETVGEMSAMVGAMLAHAVPLSAPDEVVDTCGTGGDASHSINISTIAAFVVAGAGATVCKHGGRAASSAAGSADVLEALGVAIELGPEGVRRCLDAVGMGFCFAPRYHPAMRHAVPVRRELGIRTAFNFLGPLANPARARHQVVGVSDPAMAEKMLGVLAAGGARRALVVFGHDGLDELTTTDRSTIFEYGIQAEGVSRSYDIDPGELGLAACEPAELRGADAATNAEHARRVLEGAPGPHRDIVLLNAAAGLLAAGVVEDLPEGLAGARRSIDTGAAREVLDNLARVSQAAADEGL